MLVRLLTLGALTASLLLSSTAHAADPIPAARTASRRVAIVVGANEAAPGRQPLRYSHADAQMLADTLVQVGHFAKTDVHVLIEPRPGEVLTALDRASRELAAIGPDTMLLFYYSGHSDGQHVFPHGEKLPLVDLRDRLGHSSARVRIAIVDTCRGGSWTRAKGLTVGPPLDAMDLMNVATEGTALLSSSSGVESAHEAGSIKGSFFTHHLNAGLLGAADTSGDGNVTLQEAFVYARERTVRDSARMAATTQHPSFDMQLRGRQDIVLAQTKSSRSALDVSQKNALEIIHLGSGATVAETPPGVLQLRLALVPGRYVVRRVEGGRVHSKEIVIGADATVTLDEGELVETSGDRMAMKAADEGATPAGTTDTKETKPAADGKDASANGCTPCCPKCSTPCAQECECDEDAEKIARFFGHKGVCHKKEKPWEKSSVVGVRGAVTHTSGAETDGTYGAAMAQVASEQYKTEGFLAVHGAMNLALGGGSAALEGSLGGSVTGGIRLPVGDHHGPVARIGLGAELTGNDRFYFSRIRLPVAEVSYQYLRDRTILELGMRGGAIITGRYNTGHRTRREIGDGSLEWGPYLAAHSRFGRVDLSFARIEARDEFPGGPVDVFRGWACGYVIDKIAVCGDAMLIDGGAYYTDATRIPTNVVTVQAGLTVGFLEF